jgi:hypothetical protein
MTLYAISFMGDSLTTSAPGYGLAAADEHPYRTVQALAATRPALTLRARAFGIGGNTSAQMVARKACLTQFEVPRVGVLYAGANDPVFSSTVSGTATTSAVAVQSGQGQYYGAGSWVTIGSDSRQIAAVSGDTLTLATPLSAAPAAGAAVTIDTRRNLVELGRFLLAAGCSRFLIHGQHMKNWTSGGDTLTTEEPAYAGLRVAQQQAVTDLAGLGADAHYVDNLAAMRALIQSGAETLGSNAWHVYANNQHINCRRTRADPAGRGGGHDILAANAAAAINARPGWVR